jgi:oligoendopeptidase F
LEAGGYWFQQGHIFEVPFYYIDYVLAQSCVFQLWQRALTDPRSAWQDYLSLCRAGGSRSFTQLLPLARLTSPLAAGTVSQVTQQVQAWLAEHEL